MYLQPIPASVNRILPAMHSTAILYHSVRQTLACDMSMWILIILKMLHLYPDKAVYMIISFQIFL